MFWILEEPAGHFVTGHVTESQFRSAVETYFGPSLAKPDIPPNAEFFHVYIRSVPSNSSDSGREIKFTKPGRGAAPVTYWEIVPNRIRSA